MSVDIIARALAAKALQGGTPGGGGSTSDVFEVSEPTTVAVGNIPVGAVLEGKTWQQILTMMLYGDVYPVLTAPSLTVTLDQHYGQIGETVTITGVATFDRGSIVPSLGTSGYRSGLPTSYVIGGVTHPSSSLEYHFSTQVTLVEGGNTISVTVNYGEGEQPYDGAGNPYDAPLPAGSITATATINGTESIYILDANGNLVPLDAQVQFDENGMVEITVPAESVSGNKQGVAFVEGTSQILGVQQYDPSRGLYDWIYGSPQASLTAFESQPIIIDINGVDYNYTQYTNATVRVGSRQLRFFTQLPEVESNTTSS